MVREIVLMPHNPAWACSYEREASWLTQLLGPEITTCHHIRSTAIPGIHAKPTIDILLVVRDIETLEDYAGVIRAAGYLVRGEGGIPGRRYFRKGTDARHTHHVHAYERGNPQIRRHVLFGDYLRAHPAESLKYEALKLELVKKHCFDSVAYTDGKDEFIRDRDRRARAWGANRIVEGG